MTKTIDKKTKQLTAGDMVLNVLNKKFYPLVSVRASGSGYVVTLDSNDDGCNYYADYSSYHTVKQ